MEMETAVAFTLLVIGVVCQSQGGVNPVTGVSTVNQNTFGIASIQTATTTTTDAALSIVHPDAIPLQTLTSLPNLTPSPIPTPVCESVLEALLTCAGGSKDSSEVGIPIQCLEKTGNTLLDLFACHVLDLPPAQILPLNQNFKYYEIEREIVEAE